MLFEILLCLKYCDIASAMKCPFCDISILQDAKECPECSLSFKRAMALEGLVPRLDVGLADHAQILSAKAQVRIRRSVSHLERKFPEVMIQIVTYRMPEKYPFSLHAFRLFNAAAISKESRRGSANLALMILIDPKRMESAIVSGYGLEPVLDGQDAAALLAPANDFFSNQDWHDGLLKLLENLMNHLEKVSVTFNDEQKLVGEY